MKKEERRMQMNDPYNVLGVSSTATEEEISKAYKKLARQYHPDLNPGNKAAEAKMKEINTAYETIKDIRSGKKTYTGTDSSYSGYSRGYRTYGNDGSNYTDPFDVYRNAYGGRYYEYDFSDLFGRRAADEKKTARSFGVFDIFRSFIRVSLIMTLLRFVFSLFFFPVF